MIVLKEVFISAKSCVVSFAIGLCSCKFKKVSLYRISGQFINDWACKAFRSVCETYIKNISLFELCLFERRRSEIILMLACSKRKLDGFVL